MRFQLPDMHRIDGRRADWEKIPPEEWNPSQVRAAQTHGIDTPGNRETFQGALYSLGGLACIHHGHTLVGTILLGIGGYKDIKDGKVADATGTKSPIGEGADAAADAALIVVGVPVFIESGLITKDEGVAMLGLVATKTIGYGVGKLRGQAPPQPSRFGKIGMFGQRAGVGLRLASRVAEQNNLEDLAGRIKRASDVTLHAGIALSAIANLGYLTKSVGQNPIMGAEA
ncbi:MAG: CDP-alcohol phosphatidyltransferase family protein [Candidatus Saccharibacteria bacterium]